MNAWSPVSSRIVWKELGAVALLGFKCKKYPVRLCLNTLSPDCGTIWKGYETFEGWSFVRRVSQGKVWARLWEFIVKPYILSLLCFLTAGQPQAPTIMLALPRMNCLPNSIPRTVSQLSCFSQGTAITEMEKKLIWRLICVPFYSKERKIFMIKKKLCLAWLKVTLSLRAKL